MVLITTSAPPSKTGIDALIELEALKRFVRLLEFNSIDYVLVDDVALTFLKSHLEISQVEELRNIVRECRDKLQRKRFS